MPDHGVVEARVANALDLLLSACEPGDFESVRDAVFFWQDGLSDEREAPAFVEALASGVRDAIDQASDVAEGEETCHIAISWPARGTTARFRFGADGAGDELSEVVLASVRRSLSGLALADPAKPAP